MKSNRGIGTAVAVVLLIVALLIGVFIGFNIQPMIQPPAEPGLPEKIKIGHLLPQTGPLGVYQEGFLNGVRLAVWEVNQAGGIAGRQVEIIEEDTQTDATAAAEAAHKLIDVDGVQLIIGAYASSCTLPAAKIAEESHVVQISPASTSPLVSEAGIYIFRVVPSDALQGAALADIAISKGYKKAATIVISNPYGIGIEEIFKGLFVSAGGQVVTSIRYELELATYKTDLEQIKASNPDVIIDVSYADDGQIIFREAKELGIEIPWVAAEGVADTAIFEAPGLAEAMTGMVGTKPLSPEIPGRFLDIYRQRFGEDPGIYADYAYDATRMGLMAIAYAGVYDGEAIRNALNYVSQGYKGATGDKTFDDKGDVGGEYMVWIVKGNEFVETGKWSPDLGLEMQD